MIWPDQEHDDLSAARGIMVGIPLGLLLWLLISIFGLAACAMPTPITVCPRATDISPGIQRQAAEELKALPAKPALRIIVSDWILTRDRLLKCQ